MKHFSIISLIAMIIFITGCSAPSNHGDSPHLKVSAAISLTDALEEIKASYERDHNVSLSYNLAGSGTLAQQIQQGAPVDVFISANEQWMDVLEAEEVIKPNTRVQITGNNLVLIVNKNSSLSYKSFDEITPDHVRNIAIGNPESVPAGKYTKDALTTLGLWTSLQDILVYAKDVRQVLTYVELGNADIGFVYESDAISSDNITILATSETGQHDPIVYPGAIVENTKHTDDAKAFLKYLLSKEAQEILAKHGFTK